MEEKKLDNECNKGRDCVKESNMTWWKGERTRKRGVKRKGKKRRGGRRTDITSS